MAINPWKFHHSTTKIVIMKLFTNRQSEIHTDRQTYKQTNRQANRGENNMSPTSLAEVKKMVNKMHKNTSQQKKD